MKLKIITIATLALLAFTSCGKDSKKEVEKSTKATTTHAVKEVEKKTEEKASKTLDLNAPTLDNKGIGPVKSLTLAALDNSLAEKGKEIFKQNCTACHKIKKRYIGPGLKDITKRRSPEWIMNMILNTEEMLTKDAVAKALIAEYNAPMAQQKISEEEARAILEFLRTK